MQHDIAIRIGPHIYYRCEEPASCRLLKKKHNVKNSGFHRIVFGDNIMPFTDEPQVPVGRDY